MSASLARPSTVNWNDPELAALLNKSANWSLDNRVPQPTLPIELHVGWQATVGHAATLLMEKERTLVIATDFPLAANEHVRIDRLLGAATRTHWGIVADSRPGQRPEDEGKRFIHWVHLSR